MQKFNGRLFSALSSLSFSIGDHQFSKKKNWPKCMLVKCTHFVSFSTFVTSLLPEKKGLKLSLYMESGKLAFTNVSFWLTIEFRYFRHVKKSFEENLFERIRYKGIIHTSELLQQRHFENVFRKLFSKKILHENKQAIFPFRWKVLNKRWKESSFQFSVATVSRTFGGIGFGKTGRSPRSTR
jgi:MoaA/NifB/PqqE/SkfB family radical SAM enzyme